MDENAFNKGESVEKEQPIRRQTSTVNDVDDIPIPVGKPKTFEELLEEEMRKGEDGGGIQVMNDKPAPQSTAGQKKQFLKRKSGAPGIPTGRAEPKKSYKYYADNFEKPEDKLQTFVAKASAPPKKSAIQLAKE